MFFCQPIDRLHLARIDIILCPGHNKKTPSDTWKSVFLYSAPFPATRCPFRYLQQRVSSILVLALLRAQIMVARVKVV
jgi:hypothetical protein